jgi:hypothetical protein
MRKLIDYFWAFVRKGDLKPYEHGPAIKFAVQQERDENGKFVREDLLTKKSCGDNCNCNCES